MFASLRAEERRRVNRLRGTVGLLVRVWGRGGGGGGVKGLGGGLGLESAELSCNFQLNSLTRRCTALRCRGFCLGTLFVSVSCLM